MTTTKNSFKRKLIGKGAFTRAYQIDVNKVEVVTICPAKECYAMFSQGNPFAPIIESVDTTADGQKRVYHMPLYPKMKAITRQLNPESLEVYRQLRKLGYTVKDYQDFCHKIDDLYLSPDVKAHIKELAGDVCNAIDCSNTRFEISPRNVSCDDNGNLIMLDCFFCMKTLFNSKGWVWCWN